VSFAANDVVRPRDTRLLRLFGLAMSFGAVLLLVATLDVRAALAVLGSADLLPLLAVVPVVAAQVVVRALRWRLLLPRRPDGARPRLSRTTTALLIGYVGNATLPARLGEPIRAMVIARTERLPGGGAFGSVVLERVVDTAALATVGLCAAVAVGAPGWIVNLGVFVALVGLGLLLLLSTSGLDPFVAFAERVAARLPDRGRRAASWAIARTRSFADGVSGHRRRPDVAGAAVLSVLAWLLDGLIFWLVGQAIGLPLGAGEALVISTVGALATAIPSAPGFLGTFEVAVAAAAAVFGATGAQALALALATHAIVLGPILIAGVVALARAGLTLGSLSGSAADPALDGAAAHP
jgi:glycosyltransferase 2 family protein